MINLFRLYRNALQSLNAHLPYEFGFHEWYVVYNYPLYCHSTADSIDEFYKRTGRYNQPYFYDALRAIRQQRPELGNGSFQEVTPMNANLMAAAEMGKQTQGKVGSRHQEAPVTEVAKVMAQSNEAADPAVVVAVEEGGSDALQEINKALLMFGEFTTQMSNALQSLAKSDGQAAEAIRRENDILRAKNRALTIELEASKARHENVRNRMQELLLDSPMLTLGRPASEE
jgi:hypothetical protein